MKLSWQRSVAANLVRMIVHMESAKAQQGKQATCIGPEARFDKFICR